MAASLATIVLSAAGTAWLLDGVRESGDLARWDGPTLRWLVAHREPLATSVMTAVTTIGGEVVLSVIAALTVLLLAVRRHRVEALIFAVALGAGEALSLILKFTVGRARPPAADVLGRIEHTLSFPSGHTIGTATFTLTLAYLWWRARPSRVRAWSGLSLALALTAVMATSRLYLGVHWLTDVLASIVLSFGVVASVILWDTWMQRGSEGPLIGSAATRWKAAALLFDNDGVLVDSNAAGEDAWVEWAQAHHLDPAEVLAGIHGRRSLETVALFVPADQVVAATAQIDALELASAGRTRALPGAADLIGSVPDDARAVVTSAPRALVLARLVAAGIPVPAVVVTSEDVAAGKPAPDPYLLAAERLGLDIADCAVFEDSANGIAAALAAGAGTIVGVGLSALGLGCDVVIPDLTAARWTGERVETSRTIERGGRTA